MSTPSEIGRPEFIRRLCVSIVGTATGRAPPFTFGMVHKPAGLAVVLENGEGIFHSFVPGDFEPVERRVGVINRSGALDVIADYLKSADQAAEVGSPKKRGFDNVYRALGGDADSPEAARAYDERGPAAESPVPFTPDAEAALLRKYRVR